MYKSNSACFKIDSPQASDLADQRIPRKQTRKRAIGDVKYIFQVFEKEPIVLPTR